MILARALLLVAAAMLAAGCGALGYPEARAPLSASSLRDCDARQAAARTPSEHAYQTMMP